MGDENQREQGKQELSFKKISEKQEGENSKWKLTLMLVHS